MVFTSSASVSWLKAGHGGIQFVNSVFCLLIRIVYLLLLDCVDWTVVRPCHVKVWIVSLVMERHLFFMKSLRVTCSGRVLVEWALLCLESWTLSRLWSTWCGLWKALNMMISCSPLCICVVLSSAAVSSLVTSDTLWWRLSRCGLLCSCLCVILFALT